MISCRLCRQRRACSFSSVGTTDLFGVRPIDPCNHGTGRDGLVPRRCKAGLEPGGRGRPGSACAGSLFVPQSTEYPPGSGRVVASAPLADPSVLAPAATELSPPCNPGPLPRAGLAARPIRWRIHGTWTLLGLSDVETLAEGQQPPPQGRSPPKNGSGASPTSGPRSRPGYPNINLSTSPQLSRPQQQLPLPEQQRWQLLHPEPPPELRFGAQMKSHQLGSESIPAGGPRSPGPVTNFEQAQNQYLMPCVISGLQVAQS